MPPSAQTRCLMCGMSTTVRGLLTHYGRKPACVVRNNEETVMCECGKRVPTRLHKQHTLAFRESHPSARSPAQTPTPNSKRRRVTESGMPEPPAQPEFDSDYDVGGAEDYCGSDAAGITDDAAADDDRSGTASADADAARSAPSERAKLPAGLQYVLQQLAEDSDALSVSASEAGTTDDLSDDDLSVCGSESDTCCSSDDGAGADTAVADAEHAAKLAADTVWTRMQLMNEILVSNMSDQAANRLLGLLRSDSFIKGAVPASVAALKKTVQGYRNAKTHIEEAADDGAGDKQDDALQELEISLETVGLHDMGLSGPLTFYWQDPTRALQTVMQSSTRAQIARKPVEQLNDDKKR